MTHPAIGVPPCGADSAHQLHLLLGQFLEHSGPQHTDARARLDGACPVESHRGRVESGCRRDQRDVAARGVDHSGLASFAHTGTGTGLDQPGGFNGGQRGYQPLLPPVACVVVGHGYQVDTHRLEIALERHGEARITAAILRTVGDGSRARQIEGRRFVIGEGDIGILHHLQHLVELGMAELAERNPVEQIAAGSEGESVDYPRPGEIHIFGGNRSTNRRCRAPFASIRRARFMHLRRRGQ